MNFYHELSPLYDEMINFSNRLETEKDIFKQLLKNYPAHIALDAGCGSGFHTILLSQLNLTVTGIDSSLSMLELAEKNSKNYGVNPSYKQGDFLSLNLPTQKNFDAIFCLGNSFVHLLSEEDQMKSLLNFRKVLKEDGYLCLQIVNYDKILKNKQKILAVRKLKNHTITRLYTFKKDIVEFTVKVETEEDSKEFSTELYPLQSHEVQSLLVNAGFDDIQIYGDLKLNPYIQFESDNICLFCRGD